MFSDVGGGLACWLRSGAGSRQRTMGKRKVVWEPVDCEGFLNAKGAGNVAFVAGVVIKGWTQVPTVNTMGCHVGLLHWSDVGDNSGARRGEGCVQELNALLRQEWADSFR